MRKILILILISSLAFISCVKDDIPQETTLDLVLKTGVVMEGDDTFSLINSEGIVSEFQGDFKAKDMTLSNNSFELIRDNVDENYFMIRAYNSDRTVSIGRIIKKEQEGYTMKTRTCTCTGCTNGCNVSVSGGTCYCSPCFPSNSGSCKKTETITIKD